MADVDLSLDPTLDEPGFGESQCIAGKVSEQTWNAIEKPVTAYEKNALCVQVTYVNFLIDSNSSKNAHTQNTSENIIEHRVLGDEFYAPIHTWLLQHKIILSTCPNINTTAKKAVKSVDKLRQENTVRSVMKNFNQLKGDNIEDDDNDYKAALSSDIVEFIGVGFILLMTRIIKCKTDDATAISDEIIGIMVSIQRFISQCVQLEGSYIANPVCKKKVALSLQYDISEKYKEMEKHFPFDGIYLYSRAPHLLYWSPYDKYLPQNTITIRDHQQDIIKTVVDNIHTGFFCTYRAMIGSGKTTSVCGIAKYIMWLRYSRSLYKRMQLLFACNLISVRNQVAQICFNMSIPFGIARIDSRNEHGYRVVNNYNCKSDADRVVLIASPELAASIIEYTENGQDNFILFHDEPTIGADMFEVGLEKNVKLMTTLTKRTIMSSATLPNVNVLAQILSPPVPTTAMFDIISTDIQVSCDIKTFNSELVVPFSYCETSTDLKKVIDAIKNIPFLGRSLTSNVALALWSRMHKLHINVPDIATTFKNVANMNASSVRDTILVMLAELAKQDDAIVRDICTNLNKDDEHVTLEHKSFGTSQAFIYPNMSLIATTNPSVFVLDSFGELLNDLEKVGIVSATKLFDNYTKLTEKFNTQLEETISKMKTDGYAKKGGKLKAASSDEREKMRNDLENNAPSVAFPEWAQIGTVEHYAKYCPRNKKDAYRTPLMFEMMIDHFYKLSTSEQYILLLMCGIGVYQPSARIFDDTYFDLVLELASEGKLAYVVADASISYGTNYPFNRVIITDDFAKVHSTNTLLQLMGRAGRVGKSWKAEVIMSNIAIKNMFVSLLDQESNIELSNIKRMIIKIKYDRDKFVERLLITDQKANAGQKIEIQVKAYGADSSSDDESKSVHTPTKLVDIKTQCDLLVPKSQTSEKPPETSANVILKSWSVEKSVDVITNVVSKSQSSERVDASVKFVPKCQSSERVDASVKFVPKCQSSEKVDASTKFVPKCQQANIWTNQKQDKPSTFFRNK